MVFDCVCSKGKTRSTGPTNPSAEHTNNNWESPRLNILTGRFVRLILCSASSFWRGKKGAKRESLRLAQAGRA